MYEVPPNLPTDGSSHAGLSCLRRLWIVASSLGATALARVLIEHDIADLGITPAARPFGVSPGSTVVLFYPTLALTIARLVIIWRDRQPPPRWSVRWWILAAFWVLVGVLAILLGLFMRIR